MANRTLSNLQAIDRGQVVVSGSFLGNGGSSPVAASNKGLGWSVVRTSAGLYTVTLSEPFADIVGVLAGLSKGTADAWTVQAKWASAGTPARPVFSVTVLNAGVATDLPAAANNAVFFVAALQHSASKPY